MPIELNAAVAFGSDEAARFARVLDIELQHTIGRALASVRAALGHPEVRAQLRTAVHAGRGELRVTTVLSASPPPVSQRSAATRSYALWTDSVILRAADGPGAADQPDESLLARRVARGVSLALGAACIRPADPLAEAWGQLWIRPQSPRTNAAALALLDGPPIDDRPAARLALRAYAAFRAGNFGWHGVEPIRVLHDAVADAERAIALDDDDGAESAFVLGMAALALDETTLADRSLQAALAADPSFAPAQGNLGILSMLRGDVAGTVRATGHALAISPHEPLRVVWLGTRSLAHTMAGKVDLARADAAQAVRANPEHRLGLLALAVSNAIDGRRDEALQAIDALRRLRDERFDDALSATNLRSAYSDFWALAGPAFECARALIAPGAGSRNQPASLMIRTLGTFVIERNGRRVDWGRKAPRKPLELLKVIIALGGRAIPVEEVLALPWPEEAGPAVRRRFDSALWRLRRLLGDDLPQRRGGQAIVIENGLLGLRPDAVEVDAYAFFSSSGTDLYHGEFLPGDAGAPWSSAMRESLRELYQQRVAAAAETALGNRDFVQALAACETGIGIDPLGERLYQLALRVCTDAGWRAEGTRLYERLRRSLSDQLGVSPSTQTDRLHCELIRNARRDTGISA